MKIKRIKLIRFKRFSDLTIDDIPQTTRLVMMAGPNGCGKSSLFDALHTWHAHTCRILGGRWEESYHAKQTGEKPPSVAEAVQVEFFDTQPTNTDRLLKAISVRSAYRNEPNFEVAQLNRIQSGVLEKRFARMIDNDAAVSLNYQRLAGRGLEDLFEKEAASTTMGEYREKAIGEVQKALLALFPDLRLNSLGNPLVEGTFKFDKGKSAGFHYKNLSGGEKAAFDLLLDLIIKKREFNDTVFCIDEPDAHMSTRLQGALLRELCKLIPDNSQLWIATHSIGMMRAARDLYTADPGTVAFLDFEDKDFDTVQQLGPVVPSRAFWHRVLNVALDDLSELVAPSRVVICKGDPRGTSGGPNVAHDAQCYDSVFADGFPDTRFISAGNAHQVGTDQLALAAGIEALVRGVKIIRLIDRDDRSAQEIAKLEQEGVRVLSRRHLESYLFDQEVLTALCQSKAQPSKVADLLQDRELEIQASITRGNPPDDIKSAAGGIYVAAKKHLQATGMGNDWRAFMRDTLAPLLKAPMQVYDELRRDVFGSYHLPGAFAVSASACGSSDAA